MTKKKKSKVNQKPFPIFLFIGGGIALIVAALLLANSNKAAPTEAPIAEEIPYPEIQRASLEDAKTALASGSAILVDVRSAEAYAGQHIAGAINIPTAELESRLGELDPNQWIIPYCT